MGKMRTLVDGMAGRLADFESSGSFCRATSRGQRIFSGADAVGICKLPPYAVYSHNYDPKNPDAGIPVEAESQERYRDPDRSGLADRRSVHGPRLDKQFDEHALLFQLGIHRDNPRRRYSPPRLSREGP